MQISSLINQSAITTAASYNGTNVTANSAETGAQDNAQGLDKVTLSSEGIEKSKASGDNLSGSTDVKQKLIQQIKEKIEKVKAEIEELEKSNLPEDVKEAQIKAKQQELSVLQAELLNALTEQ